jgi:hypothetical protein|tara:strand:- start:415 stop:1407 length:993 start_codon:yes stop_codon:yes gene_type:complete
MDKKLRSLRDVDAIERQRKKVTDKSLLIYEHKANRDAGFKMFTPELKRITHLMTKARAEANFRWHNSRASDSVALEEMIIKNNHFDFFNMEGFNNFISSHMNHCYSLRRHRRDRAYEIARNKDRYSGLVSPRQKFLAIKKEDWARDFGSRKSHQDAWNTLVDNVCSSKFELECGGFNHMLVHMEGLNKLEDILSIGMIETKVILYAELISTNQHGLKVFKAKWIKPANDFPNYTNESGFIFLFEGIALAYKKNVSPELRISREVNAMLNKNYGPVAMKRINDTAGKPIPYYLYGKIKDYINNHSGNLMDAITDFRFQVLMANELNVEDAA